MSQCFPWPDPLINHEDIGTIHTELGLVLLRCKSLYSFLWRRKIVCVVAPRLGLGSYRRAVHHQPWEHNEAAEDKLQVHLLQEQLYVRMCMVIVSTACTEEIVSAKKSPTTPHSTDNKERNDRRTNTNGERGKRYMR